jgi:phosphate transport system substrate-binding protein
MRTSLTAILCAAVIVSGCSAGAVPKKEGSVESRPNVPPGAVLLEGAGATFPAPLYEDWFRRYQQAHPNLVISYDVVGSGEGVRRFIGNGIDTDEQVDFGASDAAMRDEEIASLPGGVVMLPVTGGSVALAYNLPDSPGELKLSRRAYVGIFSGQITQWNDPVIASANPTLSLPDLTITTVVRQDSSGTTFAFTRHLDAISEAWRSQYIPSTLIDWPGNAMRAQGNEGVTARITQSIGSIGYVSHEFARRAGLRVATLENRAGQYVAPTLQSSSAALAEAELPDNLRAYVPDPVGRDSYPIVTLTWILLRRNYADPQRAANLRDLFRWCLTDGQKYAAELGFTPLPARIVDDSLAALDGIAKRP